MAAPKKDESERQRSVLEKLFALIDAKQARQISDALIEEFGSICSILSESRQSLQRVIGNAPLILDLIDASGEMMLTGLAGKMEGTCISATNKELIEYLIVTMGGLKTEKMRILFLNRRQQLIADEELGSGSIFSLSVYPRNIFKRAFELGATGIILVHNHPGGNARPSKADIKSTGSIISLGKELEVTVNDHIIIAGNQWSSFRGMGLL